MPPHAQSLDQPIRELARTDFTALPHHFTVDQTLRDIRQRGIGERVVYSYVLDNAGRRIADPPTVDRRSPQLSEAVVTVMAWRGELSRWWRRSLGPELSSPC
ncbi:MAG TPA: hypothetical protein PLX89_04420 [Verrucomicrobiota bacterium]|nr:hypothetical protein [Verrucomicrobiales bacterium]HRI12230.1 hypothetical protein [Verrucomicrobiota bacterium]